MQKKIIKYFIKWTSALCGISSFAFYLSSCTKNQMVLVRDYDFVSLDPSLTGNLAALGFKPTIQSLYNNETMVPEYVADLNVKTEAGQQPSSANAELWLSRKVQAMYGYSYNQSALPEGASKHFITYESVMNEKIIEALKDRVDASAFEYAKTWSFDKGLLNLATALDKILETKNHQSIFNSELSPQQFVNKIQHQLVNKINLFHKDDILQTPKSISFWGASYGPNWVSNKLSFDEYGPSTSYPGWMFDQKDSLNLVPSVPTDQNYKLSVKPFNGFNTLGWNPTVGTYEPKAVQQAFYQSSDYVVVAIESWINNDVNVKKIKSHFEPILKSGLSSNNIIIVDVNQFSLSHFNFLGIEYSFNLLTQSILGEVAARKIVDTKIFNTENLRVLSENEFEFKTNN